MDSVTKDTPIIITEVTEIFKTLGVDEIIDEEDWYVYKNIVTSWEYKEFADCNIFQVWTKDGWKNTIKIVRHRTE